MPDNRFVYFNETRPICFVQAIKKSLMERPILGLPIRLRDARPAFFFPPWATLVVDLDLIDRLVSMSFRQYRYRHPYSPFRFANPIAILQVVLPVLHMIQDHKHVRLPNLVEKPQQRQWFWLMNSKT